MSDKEPSIYISFSTHLKGPIIEEFYRACEEEARKFLESARGQQMLKQAVEDTVAEVVRRNFGWYHHDKDDPRREKFNKIVLDKFYQALMNQVDPNGQSQPPG